ncbi:hypothetical protein BJF88_12035 [Cellulosimicrobium sp. CUA-896]|nr:ABC transporter ATP-binding protein [Cellulosimicrobium sp. CUA-896]OLT53291.1 hypothetical protein BJF88_12035 [Cellulosimicrobium sp. CUA-896]
MEIRGLSVGYGGPPVLELDELTIEAGEFVSVLGPSGCGKSTLLSVLAGFVAPTTGTVAIDGQDVTHVAPNRRETGLVFQSYALFPHMTVRRNLEYGLRTRRVPRAERDERVADALRLVHLSDYADRYPQQLSGGQQQRVAIARALVTRPRVLLLDEPLSNLDAKLRRQMRHELRELQREVGTTTVFVTHDQAEALALSDRVALLAHGGLEQLGTPEELYRAPRTRFTADFVARRTCCRCARRTGGARCWAAPSRAPSGPRPSRCVPSTSCSSTPPAPRPPTVPAPGTVPRAHGPVRGLHGRALRVPPARRRRHRAARVPARHAALRRGRAGRDHVVRRRPPAPRDGDVTTPPVPADPAAEAPASAPCGRRDAGASCAVTSRRSRPPRSSCWRSSCRSPVSSC